jgi:hypothetical protein
MCIRQCTRKRPVAPAWSPHSCLCFVAPCVDVTSANTPLLQPYIDLNTGLLHVYSVGMYLWTNDAENASAPVNYTSISCEAAGAPHRHPCSTAAVWFVNQETQRMLPWCNTSSLVRHAYTCLLLPLATTLLASCHTFCQSHH